jgi:transcriptional regulator with XRE-family HTH domain
MEHHGNKLRSIIKAKGFNMSELAGQFGVTRAAVDKHMKSERLTRKVLRPYAEKLDFSLDAFFGDVVLKETQPVKGGDKLTVADGTVPAEIHWELQQKYFDLQERYNDLVVRFFPNAAQLAIAQS